jgi:hypothetical protein
MLSVISCHIFVPLSLYPPFAEFPPFFLFFPKRPFVLNSQTKGKTDYSSTHHNTAQHSHQQEL